MFNTLRRWLKPQSPVKKSRQRNCQLSIEALEDRSCPAITLVSALPQADAIWQEIGASPQINSQIGVANPTRPAAGAIEAVFVHPSFPNVCFVATVAGGIWRSMNFDNPNADAVTWEKINDQFPSLYMSEILLDPTDPNRLYFGTGSSTSGGFFPPGGGRAGVYRLDNVLAANVANISLTQLGSTVPFGTVQNIAVSRANPNLMIVGGDNGLFRSQNGGLTFQLLSNGTILPNVIGNATDIIYDPNPSRTATFYVGLAGDGLYRTDNGGDSWTRVDLNPPGITKPISDIGTVQIRLAIHSIAPTAGFPRGRSVIYVANVSAFTDGDKFESLWRYEEDGIDSNFDGVVDDPLETAWFRLGSIINGTAPDVNPGGQGSIHFSIAADPFDKNVVYFAGDAAANTFGNLARARYTGTLQNPSDDTAIFTPLQPGGTQPHADSRDMTFMIPNDPSQPYYLVEVDDGGIYRLQNPINPTGTGNQRWFSTSSNISNYEYYSGAFDTRRLVMFAGAQDNGSSVQTAPGSNVWTRFQGGDGVTQEYSIPGDIRYSLGNNFALFTRSVAAGPQVQLLLAAPGATAFGGGLENTSGGITDQQYTNGFEGPKPIEAHIRNGNRIMLGRRALYESFNQGDNITTLIPPTGFNNEKGAGEEFTAMIYGGRRNLTPLDEVFYAGTEGGLLYMRDVIAPGGTQIFDRSEALNLAIPGFGGIRDIAVDPSDYRKVYVIKGNQIAFSTDAGLSWTNITGNLGSLTGRVQCLTILDSTPNDPRDGGTLLVGGYGGTFQLSLQNLNPNSWSEFGNLPNVLVTDLDFYFGVDLDANPLNDTGVLIAATDGRGAFIVPNAEQFALGRFDVVITGDAGDNNIVISESQTTVDEVHLEDGVGNTLNLGKDLINSIIVNAGLGNDTIRVDSNNTITGGNTKFFGFPISVNGGGQTGDTLILGDSGTATGSQVTISDSVINGGVGDNYFAMGATLTYSNLGVLRVQTGSGNDVVRVSDPNAAVVVETFAGNDTLDLSGSTAPQVTAFGGAGTNTLIGPNNPQNSWGVQQGNIGNINGTIGFNGFNNLVGGSGRDEITYFGTAQNDNITINITSGLNSGSIFGFPQTSLFSAFENVNFNGQGGINNLSFVDATNSSYGSMSNPQTGINYAPINANSGKLFINNAVSSPTVRFFNVNGSFVVFGDDNGSGDRDVLHVIGLSSNGAPGAGSFGETITGNGSDTINVTENTVQITNATLGTMRSVTLGSIGPNTTFNGLYVRGGNESGSVGDNFTSTGSRRLNIVIDGANPTQRPGDRLTVTGIPNPNTTRTTNPAVGPPQVRITGTDGSSVGYVNIEGVTIPGSQQNNFAVALDAGGPPVVRVFNSQTNAIKSEFLAYTPAYTGGVRIAMADVNSDGISDIITGVGSGGGPHVKVFDGVSFQEIRSFYAFPANVTTGLFVAGGDVNGDGAADIIVGAGAGGGPHVKVFDGITGAVIRSFFAYVPNFGGGVSVASADFNKDGFFDIVTGAGPGGGPHVQVFDGRTLGVVRSVFAFAPNFTGGVFVSADEIDGDGTPDLVVGPASSSTPQVQVYSGASMGLIANFFVNQQFAPNAFSSVPQQQGVRVGTTDVNGDGKAELVIGKGGTGDRPRVFLINVIPLSPVRDFLVFDGVFGGGVFVAGS